jgi:hypothetical protein
MAFTGNKDVDMKILTDIESHEDFLNTCKTNRTAAEYCRKDILFTNRMKRYFPLILNLKPIAFSWKEYYLQTVYYIGIINKEFPKFTYGKESRGTSVKYLYFLRKTKDNPFAFPQLIKEIIKNKYTDILQYLTNPSLLDFFAVDIFRYSDLNFIKKNFSTHESDEGDELNYFIGAYLGGNVENLNFLKKKFPDFSMNPYWALYYATMGDNKFLIEELLKETQRDKTSLILIIFTAYEENNTELAEYYLSQVNLSNNRLDLSFVYEEVNEVLFLKALIYMTDTKLISLTVKEIDKEPNYTEHFLNSLENLATEGNEKNIDKLFNLGCKFDKEEVKRRMKEFNSNFPGSFYMSPYLKEKIFDLIDSSF